MKHRFARLLGAVATGACLFSAAASSHALEYSITDLGTLGGMWQHSYATGINNSGQVVGYGYDLGQLYAGNSVYGNYQAFVTGANGTGLAAIPTLASGNWSKATGISDNGWVVGTSATRTKTRPWATLAPSSTGPTAAWRRRRSPRPEHTASATASTTAGR